MKNLCTICLTIISIVICNTIHSQVFDIIVAKDGTGDYSTLNEAINAIRDAQTSRTLIFIKKGVYEEKCVLPSTKTNVSLIGENTDSVIIVSNDYVGKEKPDGSIITGYQDAVTFTVKPTDFYAENITFKNSAGDVAQALAISTEGDKSVFKDCRFLGFQDTYRSGKNRQYNLNCYIEGGTDFIYGDALSLFDKCTLNCVNGGSVITAPADSKNLRTVNGETVYLGLMFNECNITADNDVPPGSYNLGRPWGAPGASSVYVNCTLGKHISAAGWTTMVSGAEESAFFAEYHSKNTDGSAFDISERVAWSTQLTDTLYKHCFNIDSFLIKNDVPWDPRPMTVAADGPSDLKVNSGLLTWSSVDGAIGYVVYRNGSAIDFSATNSYSDTVSGKISHNIYFVKSVTSNGNLSIASNEDYEDITSIGKSKNQTFKIRYDQNNLWTTQPANIQIYDLSGLLLQTVSNTDSIGLNHLRAGIYIILASNKDGEMVIEKITKY